ncbi:type VI secretion system baseplate subunit TssF [Aquabacter cavernae]|uniref:type VI secretion system baseplate subunit TssF n=1 Tax=Aquabacter cavernae TaxID=2496029 RepID=UPI000F8DD639|nr:type VI secretion system baseplate subunit TssF [Aquabacter cavernae]
MALNRYYQDELSYLRDLGDVFARENPKLAGFLSRKAADPDVERLLEGFAFLTATLRQRLDDDLPELVHDLLRLIWPAYLQPIPPTTTLCFRQAPGGDGSALSVPRGTQVRSLAIDGTSCPFITSFNLDVLPFEVRNVVLENAGTQAELTCELACLPQTSFAALAEHPLRFHFAELGDPRQARNLYRGMFGHLKRISVRAGEDTVLTLGPDAIRPVSFAPDEAVLAQPLNAVEGFRLLQEYLLIPEKFLYAELSGLEPLAERPERSVKLHFQFERPFPQQVRVPPDCLRLNCTPAVNLFPADARPLNMDGGKTEYRLVPLQGEGATIHTVDSVTGYIQGSSERIVYEPFESFRHDLPGDTRATSYVRVRARPSVAGRRIDHYLSFVDRLDRRQVPKAETVSIALTCSNGRLAERLAVGAVCQPGNNTPNGVQFENIARVTSEVPPPLADGLLWRLVAALACSFNSIADVTALRQLIATFDFRSVQDEQSRRRLDLLLSGLERFENASGDILVRGMPMRIRHFTLVCQESKLGGEAEMFLFGTVLDKVLSAFATVNSMHQFALRGSETNVTYEWKPRRGVNNLL